MPPKRRGGCDAGVGDERLREENLELRQQIENLRQRLVETLEQANDKSARSFASHSNFSDGNRVNQYQNHVLNYPRRWEAGFKFDIPDFSGNMTPDEVLDWLATTNEILEYKEVTSW